MSKLTKLADEISANTMISGDSRSQAAGFLRALDSIHKEMDGEAWSSVTLELIASHLRYVGLKVEDCAPYRECEHCERELDPAEGGNCAGCGGYTEVSS